MKDFKQFKFDLLVDESLRQALKEALGTDNIELPAERFDEIHSFAAARGYDFTVEDVSFDAAACRDLSEEELALVNAGGYADLINFDSCEQNFACYNNFGCQLTQRINRGGGKWSRGVCLANYGCSLTYNTCVISNECSQGQRCHYSTI